MSFESNTGLGVPSFYGVRTALEGLAGHVKTEGAKRQMVLEFKGANINDGVMDSVVILPANALIVAAYADVNEVVALGGTTPTILVGTNGSEVTNGLVISEAQAEAASVYDVSASLTGTWAAGLTTDTSVSVTLGGTTPTIAAGGRIKVVVEYVTVTK
jgi:hypothetical protein|tara:strand:+ start:3088 stop:3561 length:474 start_codon:yes stop_codon:yes gene_type:complete